MRTVGWAVLVLALGAFGVGVTGCGAGATPTVASTRATGAPTSARAHAAGSYETIASYVRAAGIDQVAVRRGDPGAPTIELPTPAGWQHSGVKTPEWAYDAIVLADPAAAADPPTVIAQLTKLTGPVDEAKLLEFAPGELENLPGFDAMGGKGQRTTLSGFDAFQFGGAYVTGGVARVVAQKTVIIPAKDGSAVYVLQLNANGVERLGRPLLEATSEIDAKIKITL